MVSTRSNSAAPVGESLASSTTLQQQDSQVNLTTVKNHNIDARGWSHRPTTITLIWLAISLPLVVWDTCYVLGRPHTMPGGRWHYPLWAPYDLYGRVDQMYGFKQWNLGNGFTAAQATMNIVETFMYVWYLVVWYRFADGAVKKEDRRIAGRQAGLAVVLGFSAAVMTVSKTVLYLLVEHYSGYDNIGHNSLIDLIFIFIIPDGTWLVVPTYIIWQLGGEILAAIEIASVTTGSIKED